MKAINCSDLESLYFDSIDGVADWNLPPHSGIWGQNQDTLTNILQQCPDPRRLKLTLLASHLVWPKSTPGWARTSLAKIITEFTDMSLAALENARWRLISVPVAAGSQGLIHTFLVGAGTGIAVPATWDESALAYDSLQTLKLIQRLIQIQHSQESCFIFLGPSRHGVIVEGESLGLPCYLGATAAAQDLQLPNFLATGRLDEHGQVLPVECLSRKLYAGAAEIVLFLYPQGCTPPLSSEVECVDVKNVREAVEALVCFQPGWGLKIVQAERTLHSGHSIAREICSFRTEMIFWLRRNSERITQALSSDPHIEELVPILQRWTDSTQQVDISLGNAVLACLTVKCIQNHTHLTARAAWDICALQMEKANHKGDLDELQVWTNEAETLRSDIKQNDDCARMLALHYVQKLIGERQNRYAFSDTLIDKAAQEEILELELTHQDRCKKRGPCSNAVLGKYYGTMGQHNGFLGPKFLDPAMFFFQKAIESFHGDEKKTRKEQNRDRLYQVFALSSAGQADKAEDILRSIDGLWWNGMWNVNDMTSYQRHALLRLYVDAYRVMPTDLWTKIRDTWQREDGSHPSQLIAYNLGLLAVTDDIATSLLRHAVDLCLDHASGPTIQIMAMLPLARLYEMNPTSPALASQVEKAIQPVKQGVVSVEHFSCLLNVPDWRDILHRVSTYRADLFPFMYR